MRPEQPAETRSHQMTRYLISFGAHAMDHIPDEEMPAVAKAAHEVVEEAMNAGAWAFGGRLENQKASIVATDGTVTDGPYSEAIGGFCVLAAPKRQEARTRAAQTSYARRRFGRAGNGSSARRKRVSVLRRRAVRRLLRS